MDLHRLRFLFDVFYWTPIINFFSWEDSGEDEEKEGLLKSNLY